MKIKTISLFQHQTGRFLFVRILTEDGIEGWGECSPMQIPVLVTILQSAIIPRVIGLEVCECQALEQLIENELYKIHGQSLWMAVSGIEIAMWDAWGKTLGQPVYRLLGGALRRQIPMYASSMRRDLPVAEEIERLAGWVERYGMKAVKVKIGKRQGRDEDEYPGRSEELVAGLRKRLGPDIAIMVDANSCFSPPRAIQIGRRLEQYDLFHFEEPCPYRNLNAHARVARALDVPIALGEQEADPLRFFEIVQRHAADIIQPDIIKTGGFLRMKKIAAIAEAAGVTMTPHQTKPLGTIANLHLAASTPCMHTFQEYNIEDAALRETMFRNAPKLTDGFLQLPEDPGLGVEFTDAFRSALVRLP